MTTTHRAPSPNKLHVGAPLAGSTNHPAALKTNGKTHASPKNHGITALAAHPTKLAKTTGNIASPAKTAALHGVGRSAAVKTVSAAGAKYALPNAHLTPGVVATTNLAMISKSGYAAGVRNVNLAEKQACAKAYGYSAAFSAVEFDHLISLELGGANDIKNLWPQPIAQAKVKDRLENYLHAQVAAGKMQLADVQRRIAQNWVKLWEDCGRP